MSISQNNQLPITQSDLLVAEEKAALAAEHAIRRPNDRDLWTGIAISGGGIRSATFALGAMQALAKFKLLSSFDYMSSVSGGSYLACSLQWWWSEVRRHRQLDEDEPSPLFGADRENFPYGFGVLDSERDSPEQMQNLAFLIRHAKYLAPGEGIGIWSLVGTVIRTVFISILICLPIASSIALLFGVLDQFIATPILFALRGESASDFLSLIENRCWKTKTTDCLFEMRLVYVLLIAIFVAWTALLSCLFITMALISQTHDPKEPPNLSSIITRSLLLAISTVMCILFITQQQALSIESTVLVVVFIAVLAPFGLSLAADFGRQRWLARSYRIRRALEQFMQATSASALILLAVGSIPIVLISFAATVEGNAPKAVLGSDGSSGALSIASSLITLLIGVCSSLYGYYTLVRRVDPGLAGKIFSALGAGIFLYGFASLSYLMGSISHVAFRQSEIDIARELFGLTSNSNSVKGAAFLMSSLLLLLAYYLGFTADVNHLGLHRFYRDRLMEAFMPSRRMVTGNHMNASPVADRFLLSDQISSDYPRPPDSPVPYSIVNAIAVLPKDLDRRIASRGGDNFILSALFVGCSATGWMNASEHSIKNGPFTVASAMAASGAAISGDAGYVGGGITRGRILSAAMSLLNMRLGIWIANPSGPKKLFSRVPTFIKPMLTAGILGFGHKRTSSYIELADGGNFDNLGLYELIRRRLGLILVIDGECDPAAVFPAFVSVSQRVLEDFKAKIVFEEGHGPERCVPCDPDQNTYPPGARFAQAPFFVARIYYHEDEKPGVLIYVKATMIRSLEFTTSGYWAEHQSFPHESTANQFFRPEQFEAYRNLGYGATREMIKALSLDKDDMQPQSIIYAYQQATQKE